MTKVAVACGMDLIHLGHLDHLEKAASLGEELVIIVANDEAYWQKNFCLIPWGSRIKMAEKMGRWLGAYLGVNVSVVASVDDDGTCAKTLKEVRPDIFAKGGDRDASNMPNREVDVCEEIGCEIRYGVGDLLGSRTGYMKKAMLKWLELTSGVSFQEHVDSCRVRVGI